jgi:hypothetical protein
MSEQRLPTTPVLLGLSGDQLRAVFDNVVIADYHCHYDWRSRHVTNIRDGVFYRTRYASPQGALIPPSDMKSLYGSITSSAVSCLWYVTFTMVSLQRVYAGGIP